MATNDRDDDGVDSQVFPDPPDVDPSLIDPLGVFSLSPGSESGTSRDDPQDHQSPGPAADPPADSSATGGDGSAGDIDQGGMAIEEAADRAEEYMETLERARLEEECELCEQILSQLRGLPLEKQVKGVQELAQLKREADTGADPAELAEVMEQFEVIDDPSRFM